MKLGIERLANFTELTKRLAIILRGILVRIEGLESKEEVVDTIYKQSATIDLAGSGNFTGGSIQVERVNNQVSVALIANTSHASLNAPISAPGLLPDWAIPVVTMVNGTVSTDFQRIDVTELGAFRMISRNTNGVPLARTSFPAGTTLTYPVPALTGL